MFPGISVPCMPEVHAGGRFTPRVERSPRRRPHRGVKPRLKSGFRMPSMGPGPKLLSRAGARAAARSARHSIQDRGAVSGAPRNQRRRPRRGGKPRLISGFPRGGPRENVRGQRAQTAALPGLETAPNVRCCEAVATDQSSPGSIRSGRSGGAPAEPAHRHLQIRNPVF